MNKHIPKRIIKSFIFLFGKEDNGFGCPNGCQGTRQVEGSKVIGSLIMFSFRFCLPLLSISLYLFRPLSPPLSPFRPPLSPLGYFTFLSPLFRLSVTSFFSPFYSLPLHTRNISELKLREKHRARQRAREVLQFVYCLTLFLQYLSHT